MCLLKRYPRWFLISPRNSRNFLVMRSSCGSRNLLSKQQPNQLQLHPQPLTHNRETSQIRLPQTFENTAILVTVDHPSYLLQYWGKVTALFATTKSIEAFRCRRPLVFRNRNDSECDKTPWSSTPRVQSIWSGGTKNRILSHRYRNDSKNTCVILNFFLSKKSSRIKTPTSQFLTKATKGIRSKKNSYPPIYS